MEHTVHTEIKYLDALGNSLFVFGDFEDKSQKSAFIGHNISHPTQSQLTA